MIFQLVLFHANKFHLFFEEIKKTPGNLLLCGCCINFPHSRLKYRILLMYLKICTTSGGYSNSGARGKNFQKLMLSEKKNRSDLGLHIFLPKSRCSLKKKKKGLHFDFISDFPIFLPKSRCSPKKKKNVFTQNRPLNKHLQRIQNCICCFRGGAPKKEGA